MRIGLYGGSFNPAHAGHLHVSRVALRRLRLDRLWWIVTPGNPLKERGGLPSGAERVAAAHALARDPRIVVTGFETALRSPYTVDTLRYLLRASPATRFVWIMGADSLAGFARWRGWREIAALVPIAVVDRPGWMLPALAGHAAKTLASSRLPELVAPVLADLRPPAWVFLNGPRSPLSSTALRQHSAQ